MHCIVGFSFSFHPFLPLCYCMVCASAAFAPFSCIYPRICARDTDLSRVELSAVEGRLIILGK